MKAVIHTKYGSPELLKIIELSTPKPKANELLIKVMATTVNRTDCAMLRAKPFVMRFVTGLLKPKNLILGTDFAGEVVEVGNSVRHYKVGHRVFGFNDMGLSSHAQYLAVSQNEAIAIIPDKIAFKDAAASIEGAHYARNMLNKVTIKAGDRALVNGATSAIGSACVQLLHYNGVKVTAVCDGKNAELVRAMGAVEVIDFLNEDFTKMNNKFAFVFDTVGKSSFAKCKSILEPDGVYISSELGAWSQNLFYALLTPLFGKKIVKFPFPTNRPASVNLIRELLELGSYKPLIDKTYTLNQIVEAFKYVEGSNKLGNVVITYE